ncbi:hypothetical protein [Thermospira aquatica]|uniref:Uncharacterized protein n=1 Tax=Thermospira aquatica TaxID=2828656 RepID=A0AAX3BBR4_9SPIR|nr:hypothetical protein [Thermospira aquatica]URA09619.1 hypothetical protein KDW03_08995 [Thermospira aquatica]
MIQRLLLFLMTIILETLVIIVFWFLATKFPFLYSIVVIITVVATVFWWILSRKKEKQKIYPSEQLKKQQQKHIKLFLIITGSILLLSYIGFLIKVASG